MVVVGRQDAEPAQRTTLMVLCSSSSYALHSQLSHFEPLPVTGS